MERREQQLDDQENAWEEEYLANQAHMAAQVKLREVAEGTTEDKENKPLLMDAIDDDSGSEKKYN